MSKIATNVLGGPMKHLSAMSYEEMREELAEYRRIDGVTLKPDDVSDQSHCPHKQVNRHNVPWPRCCYCGEDGLYKISVQDIPGHGPHCGRIVEVAVFESEVCSGRKEKSK